MASESAIREPLDAWLATMLELPEDASPADSQRAFLNRVEDDGFTSDQSLLLAVAQLNGEVPAEVSEQRVIEWQLRNEVEDFGKRFFKLRPGVRSEEYRRLCERTAPFPNLKRQVLKLQAGLSISRASFQSKDERTTHLIETILELFVMPPLEQAYRRRKELAAFNKESTSWKAPALVLRRQFAELARLDRTFLDQIGVAAHGKAPIDTPNGEYIATASAPADIVYQPTIHAGDTHIKRTQSDSGSRLPLLALLAIVVPVIAVVYGLMMAGGGPDTIAMYPGPENTAPVDSRSPANASLRLPGSPVAGEPEAGTIAELKFQPGELLPPRLQKDAARTGQASAIPVPEMSDTLAEFLRTSARPQAPAERREAKIERRDSRFGETGGNGNLDPSAGGSPPRRGLDKHEP
ncbi:MAG: hypothetical protein H8E37_03995 [Planctomycetes bacterium]|nr:hypothetical protein [Planctomycetota bacterium]